MVPRGSTLRFDGSPSLYLIFHSNLSGRGVLLSKVSVIFWPEFSITCLKENILPSMNEWTISYKGYFVWKIKKIDLFCKALFWCMNVILCKQVKLNNSPLIAHLSLILDYRIFYVKCFHSYILRLIFHMISSERLNAQIS